jgi:YHS domain-containing protein
MRIPLFNRRGSNRATDPVCDMQVDTNNPPGGEWEHAGQTYYFCGPGCNRAFQKEPDAYLSGEKKMKM